MLLFDDEISNGLFMIWKFGYWIKQNHYSSIIFEYNFIFL